MVVLAAAGLTAGAFAPAHAEGPAVSALNGKSSIEGGSLSSLGRTSALGLVQGSVTTPLGHSFGLQVDAAAATAYSAFLGGGAMHVFWRDPQVGLFGPIAVMSGGRGSRVGLYGAEGELYTDVLTIAARGGYQDAVNNGVAVVNSGGFYTGRLSLYPIDDLALTIEGGQYAGVGIGRGTIEYQPDLFNIKGLSIYADAAAGDQSFYRVTGGIRFYFGPAKSLKRRHREDDPPELPIGPTTSPGVGGPAAPPPPPPQPAQIRNNEI
jgi:hypothetical protein